MKGSKNMSYDAINLTTPDIKWLGVRPSDLEKYQIPPQCRLEMSEHDVKTGKELLNEEFIQARPYLPASKSSCRLPPKLPPPAHLHHTYTYTWHAPQANPAWHKELEMMVKMKVKAEIQALSSFGFQYLSQVYLPRKLKEADWI